jgi:hypothetical protein
LFVFGGQMEPFQAFGGEPSPKQLRLWWPPPHTLVSTKEPVEGVMAVVVMVTGGMPESNVDAGSPAHGFPREQARPGGQPLAELIRSPVALAVVVASWLERQSQVVESTAREHLYCASQFEENRTPLDQNIMLYRIFNF